MLQTFSVEILASKARYFNEMIWLEITVLLLFRRSVRLTDQTDGVHGVQGQYIKCSQSNNTNKRSRTARTEDRLKVILAKFYVRRM